MSFAKTLMGSGFPSQQAIAINGYQTLAQTATGSTQATAFVLQTELTEFTTVASGTGAVLPAPASSSPLVANDSLTVVNLGANALLVYPPVGFGIGLTGTNTGLSIPSGKTAVFIAKGNGNYYAIVSA